MADIASLKKVACEAIDRQSDALGELSRDIWSHPELNYEERYAHDALTAFLRQSGFPHVEPHYVVDTGFRAEFGGGDGAHVAVLCEYDALPEFGHACGHNLIAEAGIGAGIGIKAAMEAAGKTGKSIGKVYQRYDHYVIYKYSLVLK